LENRIFSSTPANNYTAMIQAFLHGWLEQLVSLIPAPWRTSGAASPDCILLSADQTGYVGVLRHRGELQPFGRFAPDQQGAGAFQASVASQGPRPLPVVLSPPPAAILRKKISLPLAARQNLRQVLEFELDYETPFRPDEVVWQYRIQRIDRGREMMDIELLIVPRSVIEKPCEFVELAGLHPAMVELADSAGRLSRINLQDNAAFEDRTIQRINLAVAGVAAVLALTAVIVPFLRLAANLMEVRGEVEQLRVVANETGTLQREIEQLLQTKQLIVNERAQVRDPLQVLAAVTQALPDTTYLTEFSLRSEQARLVGFSPSAANLIAALTDTAPFRDPTFGAPIVHPDNSQLELFTIRLLIDPTPGE